MRIQYISGLFLQITDGLKDLRLLCEATDEVPHELTHILTYFIHALRTKVLHKLCGLRAVAAGAEIDEAFQVRGDQDIHRRAGGQNKRTVPIILAGTEEVRQYLIFVGCADQLLDRHTHVLREIRCQDITEVTSRDADIDLLTLCDITSLKHLTICIDIVDHLRNQTADVDGVCRAQNDALCLQFLCKCRIMEDLLHTGLGIIEVAADRCCVGVLPRFSPHLQLLETGNTSIRIEYDDFRTRYIREAGHRRLSGITGGRGQDHDTIRHLILPCTGHHQVWEDGEGHILKCDGFSVEQLEVPCASLLYQRCDLRILELLIVGRTDTVTELLLGKIREKLLHNLIRKILI